MKTHLRTILVTGASSGLGRALVTTYAAQGARVGMVARDRARGEAVQSAIRRETNNPEVHLFVADLSDQRSIRALAQAVEARFEHLHLLVNNAASAFPQRRLNPQKIECALAVNHLAPFLLTRLLLDRLRASAPARIVNVGTRAEAAIDFADPNWESRRYRTMRAYTESKLGNLHFTFELARRLHSREVTVNCVFPGVFRSNLGGTDGAQNLFWKSIDLLLGWALPPPEQAAERVLYVSDAPELEGVSGCYFGNRKRLKAPTQARDPEANLQLWRLSERLTGLDAPDS